MPQFSQKSAARLTTCHPLLQKIFNEVIKTHDCTIIEGYRNREAQESAYAAGKTKLHWPSGNHNKQPSLAADVMPYPINWDDVDGIKIFSDFVKETAAKMGVNLIYGGDWKTFKDRDHYELANTIISGDGHHD